MRLHRQACLMAALLSPLFLNAQTPAQTSAQTSAGPAQQPEATTSTLSVAARLVTVPVIIRDKKGALIQNVPKDDFTLQVDGKPQPIRYFDQDRNIPLTLGLMVDTSQSQRTVLDDERTASDGFLDQMLTGPKDQAFIVQFARQTDLLEDVTTSRPKLRAALKQIDSADTGSSRNSNPPDPQSPDPNDTNNQGNSNGRRGGSRAGRGGGTTLYDALFLSSDELMKKQKGRKALIILSDGVDNGSKESLTKSLEAAQRADTIVYAIYFKGEEHNSGNNNRGFGFPGGMGGGRGGGFPGGGGGQRGGGGGNGGGGNAQRVDGKKILQRMADETGGRLFEVTKKQTVEQIYTQIGQELRAQYRLGFTPNEEASSDGYHQLTIALKTSDEKKLAVQTRDGYYTGN